MAHRTDRKNIEEKHWWFVGRKKILQVLAKELTPGPQLEIGCGYSGGHSTGAGIQTKISLDIEREKLAGLCNSQNTDPVCASAEQLPFIGASFASVLILDVLEHLRDDWLALTEAYRVLAPGGRALVTVPAFPSLWSSHDEAELHLRRYYRSELTGICRHTGFHVVRSGYFNSVLFPAAMMWRLLSKKIHHSPVPRDDFYTLPPFFNSLLANLFSFESSFISQFSLPFGLSVFAIIEKPWTAGMTHQLD